MKTVLYGGSFDPVHKAHIDIVENLCRRFDRVIVIPCKTSPFKAGTSASSGQRLDMLRLALSGSKAEISTFELENEGPDYSYITAEHFTADGQELFFAIGSEMLASLKNWKNFDRLNELVTFYVIPRPDFPPDKPYGIMYETADFSGREGSSSEVKISIAMGCPEMFLTGEVAAYIDKNGFYRDYNYINTLYAKYNMKPKRITHSYSVALCGVNLAKRAGLDMKQAVTSLLLHDIGKYVTVKGAEELGLKLPGEVYAMPESIRHAVIGSEILMQLEGVADQGIIDAVRWHTTGRANMSMLEIVVYLADYIEPLRDFAGVSEVRAATEVSIMDGFRQALIHTVAYFTGGRLYPATEEAYKFYIHESRRQQ